MLSKLTVYDNFLENAEKLIELAKQIDYFCGGIEPNNQLFGANIIRNEVTGPWSGFRSKQLQNVNENLTKSLLNKFFVKLTKNTYIKYFEYTAEIYLHYLPSCFQFKKNWYHTDSGCVLAAILYLNENPEKKSGTVLFDKKKKIEVENKFNRLVVFDPTLKHAAQNSFGSSINDSRLTLNIFITKLSLKA